MLLLELSLGGQGALTVTGTTSPLPTSQDVLHLHAALYQGTERGHLTGQPGQEGQTEAHHLLGKGPNSRPRD